MGATGFLSRAAAIALVAAVIAFSFGLRALRGPSSDGTDVATPAATPIATDTRTGGRFAVVAEPAATERDAASSVPPWSVGGVIVDETGALLGGLRLALRDASGAELLHETLGDEAGSFQFDELRRDGYRLEVRDADGTLRATRTLRPDAFFVSIALTRSPNEAPDGAGEGLPVAHTLTGIVRGADGTPLAGARVTASGAEGDAFAETDTTGTFVLGTARAPNARRVALGVEAAAHAARTLRVDLAPGPETDIGAVALTPLGALATVSGRVQGSDGASLEGRIVTLRSPGRRTSYRALSDARGAFRIEGVEHAGDYTVEARPDARYGAASVTGLDVGGDVHDLVLDAEAHDYGGLALALSNFAGAPLGRRAVVLEPRGSATAPPLATETDADGRIEIAELPAGRYRLALPGLAAAHVDGIVVEPGRTAVFSSAVDVGSASLSGRVLDASGAPLPGAQVRLINGARQDERLYSYSERTARTGSDGRFRFEDLDEAEYRMVVTGGDRGRRTSRVEVGPSGTEVTVSL